MASTWFQARRNPCAISNLELVLTVRSEAAGMWLGGERLLLRPMEGFAETDLTHPWRRPRSLEQRRFRRKHFLLDMFNDRPSRPWNCFASSAKL